MTNNYKAYTKSSMMVTFKGTQPVTYKKYRTVLSKYIDSIRISNKDKYEFNKKKSMTIFFHPEFLFFGGLI